MTVQLVRPITYTPIWEALMAERRPALNAAQNDVMDAQARLETEMGALP